MEEQKGIQRNCRQASKNWIGTDLFYIGRRKWGYVVKDNVTKVLQFPGKNRRNSPTASAASSGDEWVLQVASDRCRVQSAECHRRESCRAVERPTSASGGAIAISENEPNHKGSTSRPLNTYAFRPSGDVLTSESG
ncbi:hypothetical protein OUZ56_011879 [Daphnia magna]|uniref:Uncharacterized protein n=1 Tax=Daphnia magna TaxID=35525 RepID=A0ABQ9Z1E6_9CRUS|nr:hypothetical protein OUZ56_011879 [Daphnia magna]